MATITKTAPADIIATDIKRRSLIAILKANNCLIRFTKTDGTIREMTCTLQTEVTGPINGEIGGDNKDTIKAWDLDKGAFRQFRLENLRKGCKILR